MSRTILIVLLLLSFFISAIACAVLNRAVPEAPLSTAEAAVLFIIVFLVVACIGWLISRFRRGENAK